jgi:hypothetical protein
MIGLTINGPILLKWNLTYDDNSTLGTELYLPLTHFPGRNVIAHLEVITNVPLNHCSRAGISTSCKIG